MTNPTKQVFGCLSNTQGVAAESECHLIIAPAIEPGEAVLTAYDTVFGNGGHTCITVSPADAERMGNLLLDIAASAAEVNAPDPTERQPERRLANLTAQAQKVYQHMRRAGSISAREAMNDYGITSASLARRICDIEVEGFEINRSRRVHPITGLRYTRYSLSDYTPSN